MARILIINDDDSIMDAYEAVVRGMGHEPITKEVAASGPEAVRDSQADALIVDLQRPEEDEYGLRIIEELRAQHETRAFPIVLATGAGAALEPMLHRLQNLAIEVVRKPFQIEDLESAIDSSLTRTPPNGTSK